jgi:hypothetical protein
MFSLIPFELDLEERRRHAALTHPGLLAQESAVRLVRPVGGGADVAPHPVLSSMLCTFHPQNAALILQGRLRMSSENSIPI